MTKESNSPKPILGLDEHADASRPARDLMDDLTVVIPTYNRSEFFLHYLEEGLWDGVRIHLVCDGCDEEVVETLKERTADRPIRVLSYQPNQGVAHAVRTGVERANTSHFMFCGDDDYKLNFQAYLEEAAAIKNKEDDVLYVTMPYVQVFNKSLATDVQYDRRKFDGWTGRRLLRFLVETGEMRSLAAGSVFRTADVKGCMAESFFRVSEDFVMLCRLFARFPERRLRVANTGRRMRLVHENSLSAQSGYSLDKGLLNLISMGVGARYLVDMEEVDRSELAEIYMKRGRYLQQNYGLGQEAGAVMAALVSREASMPTGAEVRATLIFLREHQDELPDEFTEVLTPDGRDVLTEMGSGSRHATAQVS